jgi:hypothetical protein
MIISIVMTIKGGKMGDLRELEGLLVGLALADGSRIDECRLVAAPRANVSSVWVFSDGGDLFLPRESIRDAWEIMPCRLATKRSRRARN